MVKIIIAKFIQSFLASFFALYLVCLYIIYTGWVLNQISLLLEQYQQGPMVLGLTLESCLLM